MMGLLYMLARDYIGGHETVKASHAVALLHFISAFVIKTEMRAAYGPGL